MFDVQGTANNYAQLGVNHHQYKQIEAKTQEITESSSDQTERRESLKRACQDFEALFLQMVLKEMRKTVPETEMFSGGLKEDIFKGMHDQELADHLANSEGLGLADILYRQLTNNV